MQYGAIARKLVVLVENVQAELARRGPVVHRLEGDKREPTVDRSLCHVGVLHTVRPPPKYATVRKRCHVSRLRLGKKQHVR